MLTQKINALKLGLAFLNDDTQEHRFSILDMVVLLIINEHPESGKADLCEIIYGDRAASKSSLDRPVSRLESMGVISSTPNKGSTKSGNSRTLYKLTAFGEKFLKNCI